jgi:hypothetical protein
MGEYSKPGDSLALTHKFTENPAFSEATEEVEGKLNGFRSQTKKYSNLFALHFQDEDKLFATAFKRNEKGNINNLCNKAIIANRNLPKNC